MWGRILNELKEHSPFTVFGALTGVALMWATRGMSHGTAQTVFYVFHPAHVFMSAVVTGSLYHLYQHRGGKRCNPWMLLLVGYIGSVGLGTLSDSLMPLWGETLLDMPHRHAHIGFIEMWWLVNPLALAGIAVAYLRPRTKLPHAAHVLLSTWASLFHMVMARGAGVHWTDYIAVFVFLFLAVWLPCCVSDIVFPMLFVGRGGKAPHLGRGH